MGARDIVFTVRAETSWTTTHMVNLSESDVCLVCENVHDVCKHRHGTHRPESPWVQIWERPTHHILLGYESVETCSVSFRSVVPLYSSNAYEKFDAMWDVEKNKTKSCDLYVKRIIRSFETTISESLLCCLFRIRRNGVLKKSVSTACIRVTRRNIVWKHKNSARTWFITAINVYTGA